MAGRRATSAYLLSAPIYSMRVVKPTVPRWLLFPIGLGIARISVYQGELWWLLGIVLVLLDVVALGALLRLTQRFPLGRPAYDHANLDDGFQGCEHSCAKRRKTMFSGS